MSKEIIEKWQAYEEYLYRHGEEPRLHGNLFTFYWFMVWLKDGKLPGRRFEEDE